jgi:hypothetical protein
MEKFRHVAILCVGRAVLFGWLAIGLIMLSFSFNPVLAFKSGAVLAMVMASILLVKAYEAGRKNPRNTEVWLHLDAASRPMNEEARVVFRNTMREVYARFARGVFVAACVMFMLSIVFVGLGFEQSLPVPQRITVTG